MRVFAPGVRRRRRRRLHGPPRRSRRSWSRRAEQAEPTTVPEGNRRPHWKTSERRSEGDAEIIASRSSTAARRSMRLRVRSEPAAPGRRRSTGVTAHRGCSQGSENDEDRPDGTAFGSQSASCGPFQVPAMVGLDSGARFVPRSDARIVQRVPAGGVTAELPSTCADGFSRCSRGWPISRLPVAPISQRPVGSAFTQELDAATPLLPSRERSTGGSALDDACLSSLAVAPAAPTRRRRAPRRDSDDRRWVFRPILWPAGGPTPSHSSFARWPCPAVVTPRGLRSRGCAAWVR